VLGPVVAEDHWNGRHIQSPCRFKAEVSIDDVATAGGENGDAESKLPDRTTHAVDRMVVLPWVMRIGNQFIDRPVDELKWRNDGSVHHRSSSGMFFQPSMIFSKASGAACCSTMPAI